MFALFCLKLTGWIISYSISFRLNCSNLSQNLNIFSMFFNDVFMSSHGWYFSSDPTQTRPSRYTASAPTTKLTDANNAAQPELSFQCKAVQAFHNQQAQEQKTRMMMTSPNPIVHIVLVNISSKIVTYPCRSQKTMDYTYQWCHTCFSEDAYDHQWWGWKWRGWSEK